MWRHGEVEHGWWHIEAVAATIAFLSTPIAETVICTVVVLIKWHCMYVNGSTASKGGGLRKHKMPAVHWWSHSTRLWRCTFKEEDAC